MTSMRKLTHRILIFLVCAMFAVQVSARKKAQYFEQKEFNVDFNITHQILTANFVGDQNKELLIVGVNNDNERLFAIFGHDPVSQQYRQILQQKIPASSVAFDLMTSSDGYENLILVQPHRLSILNFEHEKKIIDFEIDSIYLNEHPQFIAKKEFVRDLNGDGLDDIYLSGFAKTSIFLQQTNGELVANPLPIMSTVDMGRSEISFSEKTIHIGDVNFDDKQDLIVLNNHQLEIFEQDKDGRFNSLSNHLVLPKEISAVPWWNMRGTDGESLDQSDLKHRMLEKIEDINGDSIPDLMVRQTQSSGVFDRQNVYEIYFGIKKQGKLVFNKEHDTQVSASGTLSGLKLLDINDDGKKEILVSSFDIGVSQIIGALLSGSIDQDVYIFALDDKDQYNEEPLFSEEVDLNFSLSSGSTGQAVILSADLNGDGFKEVMLSAGESRFDIFEGEPNTPYFKTRAKRHKLTLPHNGSMVISADLNNDSKQEVIIRYGKQDKESLRRKIVILSIK